MNNLPAESLGNIYNFMEEHNVKVYNETLNIYDIVNQYLEKNKGDESFVIIDLMCNLSKNLSSNDFFFSSSSLIIEVANNSLLTGSFIIIFLDIFTL